MNAAVDQPTKTPAPECPHEAATVEAYIGTPGGDDPALRGLPWEVLDPEQRDLDGVRAYVALGVCEACSSRVVSVRSWDVAGAAYGLAWSSRWTRLAMDGET